MFFLAFSAFPRDSQLESAIWNSAQLESAQLESARLESAQLGFCRIAHDVRNAFVYGIHEKYIGQIVFK